MKNLDYYRSKSGYDLYGYLLTTGDILKDTDMYDSSNGKWESCPCPGLVLQEGISVRWIRPYKE